MHLFAVQNRAKIFPLADAGAAIRAFGSWTKNGKAVVEIAAVRNDE